MQVAETESTGFVQSHVDEPVRVWIESGDGAIARGLADVLSEDGAVVRLAGAPSVAPGDEVAVRIAFGRTSPTLAATARILWIRSANEGAEYELEWTHSGPERESLASYVASLFCLPSAPALTCAASTGGWR
jgi:PilZ domain-containing protein